MRLDSDADASTTSVEDSTVSAADAELADERSIMLVSCRIIRT